MPIYNAFISCITRELHNDLSPDPRAIVIQVAHLLLCTAGVPPFIIVYHHYTTYTTTLHYTTWSSAEAWSLHHVSGKQRSNFSTGGVACPFATDQSSGHIQCSCHRLQVFLQSWRGAHLEWGVAYVLHKNPVWSSEGLEVQGRGGHFSTEIYPPLNGMGLLSRWTYFITSFTEHS